MIDENNEIEKEKSPEDNSSADISLPKQVKEKVLEKAFGPAAEEFGVGIRPVGQDAAKIVVGTVKTAKVLLSPIYGMVWGAEKIWKWINEEVESRLEGIEEAERISPDPQIAGPTIEAMRFIGEKDQLRSMFANLLATSMNRSTADSAHPSFVEVLKQITPEEAKIIEYFATHDGEPIVEIRAFDKDEKSHNYKIILSKFSTLPDKIGIDNRDIFGSCIDNLCRLELVSVPKGISIADDSAYDEIREHEFYKSINDFIEKNGNGMKIDKGVIKKTDFGNNFIKACVLARK